MQQAERFDTVVIGGGQAGLAVGYYLAKQGRNFVILDAGARVGDAWRISLGRSAPLHARPVEQPARDAISRRPARLPTKDEVADYLEAYAAQLALPVRTGVRVDGCVARGRRPRIPDRRRRAGLRPSKS